jgi:hypothetical protein
MDRRLQNAKRTIREFLRVAYTEEKLCALGFAVSTHDAMRRARIIPMVLAELRRRDRLANAAVAASEVFA